jgi:hypothetical protein
MKKILTIVSILTVLSLFFAATSQVMASPNNTEDFKKTKTPPGQAEKTRTPHGPDNQGKPDKKVNLRGSIALVDVASLMVTLKDGTNVAVGVTADTQIKIPSLHRAGTLADLQVGFKVNVQAIKNEDETLSAQKILVVPGKPSKAHHVGTVTDYQPGVSITLIDKWGNSWTYAVTADTKILPPERADQLKVGSRVTIIAPRNPADPTLVAKGIVVHPEQGDETETPSPTPSETPSPTPTETPTSTPTETPTNTPEG